MSEDRPFDSPKRVAINRVYTCKGDTGKTNLVGGQSVSKNSTRVWSYGAVDELGSFVGAARQTIAEAQDGSDWLRWIGKALACVQQDLFNLGSILATLPEDVKPRQARISKQCVERLETQIDRCNDSLTNLRSFVLPGGSRLNTDLHICRTVCRRAERACVDLAETEPVDPLVLAYLNRLGDAFFVWSRWVVARTGVEEELWDRNFSEDEGCEE